MTGVAPRPDKVADGYRCPLCDFGHSQRIVVVRHIARAHPPAKPAGKRAPAKPAGKRAPAKPPPAKPAPVAGCGRCDRPHWRLLDASDPAEARAVALGYHLICSACTEVRKYREGDDV